MSLKKKEKEESHLKSVLMAYFILVLHVVLITALVLLVIFFRGIINYMIWIFIVGTAAIVASAYHFYKRMRMQGKTLQEMLNSHRFAGRTVEINFLGGLASLKISGSNDLVALDTAASKQVKQLEDPNVIHNREFSELVRLLENNLITFDEYNKFKDRILKS